MPQHAHFQIGNCLVAALASFMILVVNGFFFADPVFAQYRLLRETAPDHELRLRSFVKWNKHCESAALAKVFIEKGPENGFVCIRRGDVKPRRFMGNTMVEQHLHCLGKPIPGVNLIYFPRPGFIGADAVHFVVDFKPHRYAYEIDIVVRENPSNGSDVAVIGSNGGAAKSLSNPATEPVPECAPLVSERRAPTTEPHKIALHR